jgi:hypothetical protein
MINPEEFLTVATHDVECVNGEYRVLCIGKDP